MNETTFVQEAARHLHEMIAAFPQTYVESPAGKDLLRKLHIDEYDLIEELIDLSFFTVFHVVKTFDSELFQEICEQVVSNFLLELQSGGMTDSDAEQHREYLLTMLSTVARIKEEAVVEPMQRAEIVAKNMARRLVKEEPAPKELLTSFASFHLMVKELTASDLLLLNLRSNGYFKTQLHEFSIKFAVLLFHHSVVSAEELWENFSNLSEPNLQFDKYRYRQLVFEFLYFYLSWVDKFAFKNLGPKNRDVFMDVLEEGLNLVLVQGKKIAPMFEAAVKLNVNVTFIGLNPDEYNARLAEYAKFTNIFGNDFQPLFNAFAFNLQKVLGKTAKDFIVIEKFACDIATNQMSVLDIDGNVSKGGQLLGSKGH